MQRFTVSYASNPDETRGRLVPEPESPPRTPFARDRDRLIHAQAFRRLKHKTQVFVYHEGDHFRTRLTHSIEVAQVARSIARAVGLDEDLAEALALAHDLGHTPFGHAGERELDRLMKTYGGFDHNAQSLRIVTKLEHRYAQFDGLNLTWETLEGLVKHNGPLVDTKGDPVGTYRERGLPEAIVEYSTGHDLELASYASAEAQVAAIADDIAYNAHDIDDGLRAGLFDLIDLGDIPLAGDALAEVLKRYPGIDMDRTVHETVRRVMGAMIRDVIAEIQTRAGRYRPGSAADVRAMAQPLATFGPQMAELNRVLQSFLRERMYRHPRVMQIMDRAQRVVRDLFEAYMADPTLLPSNWRAAAIPDDRQRYARQVCDFIAGMTDRYALDQHKHLFDLDPLFR
ncbi:MAG: deoxyguanosinetriphosphate triphosphohydrolase [Alphaproteobacteria bacterium]|nr:deoxyguanosinetriphosphate triphosphohydrolase [Alphaproteobacteria bacterium]